MTTPDPLLALPGVMHAVFWARCRSCDAVIHGPTPKGCDPCPCGATHARGDVVGLAATPTGRAWVCRGCLVASLGADVTVPEQRAGETTVEVAR